MSENLYDILDDINEIAETEQDMNESKGGGDYTPPAEGLAGLRFVTYIELGKKAGEFKGKPKVNDKVVLGFELFGPKWPLDENGKAPYVEFEMNKSLADKAGFFKIFKAMNWEGSAKIMAQLLTKEFLGRVHHRTYKGNDGKERIAVEFFNKEQGVYTIRSPHYEDPESGETKRKTVPAATRELRYFIWSKPNKKQWDGIFIDGEYEERKNDAGEVTAPARSKNKFQQRIKAAVNFKGSPIAALLEGVDDELLNTAAAETDPKEKIKAEKERKQRVAAENAAKEQAAAEAAAAKLSDQESSTAGASESDDDNDEALNDLPF